MNYLSVASGISAETLAWSPLGFRPAAFAQFDPEHKYKGGPDFASAVLAHHYPDVPNLGDMNRFAEWPDYAALDVLTGGTPCQTYSLAGLGAGLDDPRGDLALVYAAIARRYRPRWTIWENTNGVLSNDKGRSFATILGLLSGQRIEVPPGGWRTAGIVPGIERAYGLAWRVLDTQYVRVDGFGRALPQRRRRVFVVGYLGDWRRAAAVLLEPAGLSGDSPPGRRTAQDVAGTLAGGARTSGGYSLDDVPIVARPLTASRGQASSHREDSETYVPTVANPLTARMFKGVNTTMDEGQTMIPHPPEVAVTLLAGQNKTGGDRQPGMDIDTVHNLIPTEAFAFKASHFTRGKDGKPSDVAPALSADADKGDQDTLICAPVAEQPIPFDTTQLTSRTNRSNPQPGDPSHTIASSAHPPAVAFQPRFDYNHNKENDGTAGQTSPGKILRRVREALGAQTFAEWGFGILNSLRPQEILRQEVHGCEFRPAPFSRSWPVYCAISRPQDRAKGAMQSMREANGERCPSPGPQLSEREADELGTYLSRLSQPGAQAERFLLDMRRASEGFELLLQALAAIQAPRQSIDRARTSDSIGWRVRRLTPHECEFLQGFPRGFTLIPWRGKMASDGVRYKVLGNAQSINVMRWLGWRLKMVDSIR